MITNNLYWDGHWTFNYNEINSSVKKTIWFDKSLCNSLSMYIGINFMRLQQNQMINYSLENI